MQDQKFTLPFPPLQVRAGVLVVDGYGISTRVLYGKLHVEDGIGPYRRTITVDRAGSSLERLVLLGKSGTLTLESLAWLRAIGAALVHLSADGQPLTHTVPFGYEGLIRRSQALAIANGLDVDLARDLIRRKLDGQRANLVRLRASDLRGFDAMHQALDAAATIDQIRLCEARAAAVYWNAWTNVEIRLRTRDLARVPAKWTRYESRKSTLTGAPRAATNPVNSLLNYVYSLLESESRLALLSAGLDPTLGVLHADQRNRDSFALDAMEPVRPAVDAFVFDLLEERALTSRDFVELPNGICRVRAPLTHDLALTLPRWRQLMAPIVAHLAQAFRVAIGRTTAPITVLPRATSRTIAKPAAIASPLIATPRKQRQPRPYASKAWSAPRPEALALIPTACARCGKPVLKRRRRHCEVCMPEARRDHGLRAIEHAREALRAQAAAGKTLAPKLRRTACEVTIAEQHRRNRQWKRQHPEGAGGDRACFLREVMP